MFGGLFGAGSASSSSEHRAAVEDSFDKRVAQKLQQISHAQADINPNQPHVHIVYSSILHLEADAHAVPAGGHPQSWQ